MIHVLIKKRQFYCVISVALTSPHTGNLDFAPLASPRVGERCREATERDRPTKAFPAHGGKESSRRQGRIKRGLLFRSGRKMQRKA